MTSPTTTLVIGLAFNLMFMTLQTYGQSQATQAAGGTTLTPSQQCTYSWALTSNTNYAGGTGNSAASLTDCQNVCIGSSSCVAVDWNKVAVTGSQCWILTSLTGARYSSTGIDHYDLTRNCQSACTPAWTSTANTNYNGGTVNAATSVANCQSACLASSGCIAVDFNSVAAAGQQCWLLKSLTTKLSNAGITHYDLVQNCPVPYYVYLNKLFGALRIEGNMLKTTYDFNQMTYFSESVCLAETISTFNNTPNCVSLSPSSNSTNYLYVDVDDYVKLQSLASTDRFKEDASFVKQAISTSGYYYLQPSAAFGSSFYVSYYNGAISLLASISEPYAAFYRATVYVSSLPVTGTCPNVWYRISGAKKTTDYGVSTSGVSVTECFAHCLVYPNCIGVSWNGNYCFFETSATVLFTPDSSFSYYELQSTSPNPCSRACLHSYAFQANVVWTSSSYGNQPNEYACQVQCSLTSSCVGYSWNAVFQACTCYNYYSLASPSYSTNFTALTTIPSKCGCGPQTLVTYNTSDLAAVQVAGVSGFSNCYTACINNRACTGFDLRNSDCYWSTSALTASNYTTNTTYVHYTILSRASCGSGCQDKWDFFANTSMTGTTQVNAATESACRFACQANSTCTAIAWNSSSNSCFLATSSSLRNLEGTAPGWNTFNLYRLPYCEAK